MKSIKKLLILLVVLCLCLTGCQGNKPSEDPEPDEIGTEAPAEEEPSEEGTAAEEPAEESHPAAAEE